MMVMVSGVIFLMNWLLGLFCVGDDMWVWLWGYLAIKMFKMVDWGRHIGVVGCDDGVWCLPFANLR